MLAFTLGARPDAPITMLCLGAHSDDIEIGCGGTVLRLLADRPGSVVHWVVFSADDDREVEARTSAADFLEDAATSEVTVHRFRESYFPSVADEIKDSFEELKRRVTPDLVLTHRRDDEHQDHQTIGRLTWNTFRDHVIAEYEIPKYEGDLGTPNLYVPVDDRVVRRKVELLMDHFGSQRNRRWFREETFRATMALRGVECNAHDGWAEAFYARKVVL